MRAAQTLIGAVLRVLAGKCVCTDRHLAPGPPYPAAKVETTATANCELQPCRVLAVVLWCLLAAPLRHAYAMDRDAEGNCSDWGLCGQGRFNPSSQYADPNMCPVRQICPVYVGHHTRDRPSATLLERGNMQLWQDGEDAAAAAGNCCWRSAPFRAQMIAGVQLDASRAVRMSHV